LGSGRFAVVLFAVLWWVFARQPVLEPVAVFAHGSWYFSEAA
jgi:hypothetical protein